MKALALVLLASLLTGCSTFVVDLPGGGKVTRRSFLTNPTIAPFSITKPDGTVIKSEGYNHEQTQVAGRALDLAAGLLGK
jgi:hypothetical protein